MKLPELIVTCACCVIIGALGMAAMVSHEDRFICKSTVYKDNADYLRGNPKLSRYINSN